LISSPRYEPFGEVIDEMIIFLIEKERRRIELGWGRGRSVLNLRDLILIERLLKPSYII